MKCIPMADWARARGLSVGVVSRMIRDGLIPAVSVGGRMHIPADLPAPELRAAPGAALECAPAVPVGMIALSDWARTNGLSRDQVNALITEGHIKVTPVELMGYPVRHILAGTPVPANEQPEGVSAEPEADPPAPVPPQQPEVQADKPQEVRAQVAPVPLVQWRPRVRPACRSSMIPLSTWAQLVGVDGEAASRMVSEQLMPSITICGRVYVPGHLDIPMVLQQPELRLARILEQASSMTASYSAEVLGNLQLRIARELAEGSIYAAEWSEIRGLSEDMMPVSSPLRWPGVDIICTINGLIFVIAISARQAGQRAQMSTPEQLEALKTSYGMDAIARQYTLNFWFTTYRTPRVPVVPVPAREPQRAPQQEPQT